MQQDAVKQSATNLLNSWRAQMQNRPWITLSLATVIGAMLFMLLANILTAFNRVEPLFLGADWRCRRGGVNRFRGCPWFVH